ncbi:uncharacterized protein LOC143301632 [Babylonia areolata]|uniref:uncharacterized protein LOC143301632 n=1 Tax=Babylonia areolata TaxID=304850 RepID=UPI003FD54219
MSSFTFSRSASRLFIFPQKVTKVGFDVVEVSGLSGCSRFKRCLKKCRQIRSPFLCLQRLSDQYSNCHTNASLLSPKLSNQTQKHFFTTSPQHFVNRSFLLNSPKSTRKSASVIAPAPTELSDIQSSPLQQRYIYVHTSVDRWEDVPGGLVFDTAYLDSMPDSSVNPAMPLVVSLHNTPGSNHDLTPVLQAFAKSGCRVLAPAFPGTGHTEGILAAYSDVFSHSTSEKAEFVRDFLAALDVKKVDLLIGHGSGCYPAMRLTAGKDTSTLFKSTAFLSPWPHCSFKGTSQKNLLILLHDMWERPFYRPMARALSRLVTNTPNTTALERMAMVYTLYNLNFEEVGGFGLALDTQKFPRVMFFAEDDSFVDAQLSYQLAEMIGIGSDCTHRFTGQLERDKMDHFPSCLVFDKGGQHVHSQQSGVITAVLFNLLKSVRPGFVGV